MSLLPFILSELRDLSEVMDSRAPRRSSPRCHGDVADLFDDMMLYPVEGPVVPLRHHVVLRPRQLRRQLSAPVREHLKLKKAVDALRHQQRPHQDDKAAFAVNVDVQHFRPEDLSVQVLKDEGFVVVEGCHEERPDEHGFVRRQFTRRYKLPESVDPDTVTSRLTSDGVLQVTAPRKEALPAPQGKVRHVAITHTDQPAALNQHVDDEHVPQGELQDPGNDQTADDDKMNQ